MKWNAAESEKNGSGKDNSSKSGHFVNADAFFKKDYAFFPEGYFRKQLSIERKRSERSNNSFMLMLLDITGMEDGFGRKRTVRRLIKLLHTASREIDIKGWYTKNEILGVLYTELSEAGCAVLEKKMIKSINGVFKPEKAEKILISCFSFPDSDQKDNHTETRENMILYEPVHQTLSKKASLIVKRQLDIAGSLCGILVALPFFVIIPVIIKLTSKGPVFFRQKRCGLHGKEFIFLKFRSMHANNNHSIHQTFIKGFIKGQCQDKNKTVFKMKDDPRITKVGKILRKTSLDEIPQLLNVLKGDMSLVGPRPPIPYEVQEYDVWHRRRVLEAKPGITGKWQVEGRSKTTFDSMARMDIQYIKTWSLLQDLKILFKTPFSLLKGAY